MTTMQGRARSGDQAPQDRLQLREEDLEVGRPFVHPETRLEYADFHAYVCGKDPLPHARNAYIKGIWRGQDDGMRASSVSWAFLSTAEFRAKCADRVARHFDRDGKPLGGSGYVLGRPAAPA